MKFKLKVSRFITTIYIITSLITLIFLLHPKFSIIHLRKYRIPKKYSEYLKNYPGYDLNGQFSKIQPEFSYIPENETYLDFTGAGLYQLSQVQSSYKRIAESLKCNTHSVSACSVRTEHIIDSVRRRILKFFNVTESEYTVIFTQSATQSLHIVGDAFPWSDQSKYIYSKHNHNSVLGIRRLAKAAGANFTTFHWDFYKQPLNSQERDKYAKSKYDTAYNLVQKYVHDVSNVTHNLVAFPGQCNFSGIKYSLELINLFESTNYGEKYGPGRWHVLFDAAAFTPTNPLDLNKYPASFVVMSFYKIFGFPTGLGALLVRNDVAGLMRKNYFAGGSVVTASCESDFCKLKPKYSERFEDGTLNFLSIDQLNDGFDVLDKIGMKNIQEHVWAVTKYFYQRLSKAKHANGKPLAVIYGQHETGDRTKQGGVVTFNLYDKNGQYIGYNDVMKKCSAANFMIRAGCSCNPGACYNYIGLTEELIQESALEKQSCGDDNDQIYGRPLGAVRASFGYPTRIEEVDKFADFLIEKYTNYEVKQNPFEM